MSDYDRLPTPEEVGVKLGLSTRTVMDAARRGDIPYVRMPGCKFKRFRGETIDQLVADLETPGSGVVPKKRGGA